MTKILQSLTLLLVLVGSVQAQNDPVLFSVNQSDVHVSEFEYIYNKNNNDDNKYSEKSIEEYLDLYVNFKLKVEAAKSMGLDTIQSLKEELAGYQQQLAESYLIDKQVKEKLLKEAYDRSLSDIEINHILVKVKRNASPQDTLKAYKKIMEAYSLLQKKTEFDIVAKSMSEDEKSAHKGGKIGFIHAILPVGFYAFETAAYTTKQGQYSQPIRSTMGYHIIQPTDRRAARGEIEAAHILVRKSKNAKIKDTSKDRINVIYNSLREGGNWDEQVKSLSEDDKTKNKNGSLGFFGINKYDRAFEDAAFALKSDGEISKPIESKIGWHIIKRISKKDIPEYKQAKYALDQRLKNDERIKSARQSMIDRIKSEVNLKEDRTIIQKMISAVDTTTFYTFKWPGFNSNLTGNLFSINNNTNFNVADFQKYLLKEKGSRHRAERLKSIDKSMHSLYQEYQDKSLLNYEKTQLINKYPDFKSLMREYDEGILLFEATKRKIWDHAIADTTGLKEYYQANQDKYMWGRRVELTHYQINTTLSKEAQGIAKYAMDKTTPQESYEKFSKGSDKLKYTSLVKPIDSKDIPSNLKLKKGAITQPTYNEKNKTYDFYKVEKFIEPAKKKLDEARGFVIANYQDQLEKEWLEELRGKFAVKIDRKILKTLIK